MVTVRLPLPLPVGAQLSAKVLDAVAPYRTVTDRGFAALSVQFAATPERASE